MSVKEYFDAHANPQEQGYVFVLLPSRAKLVYEDYIKRAADGLNFRCESFIDLHQPGNVLDDILARIQKAEILIYDITDLNPNVMWELGIGLTIKEADKVIILREKSEDRLPFNIYSHRISYEYDTSDRDSMDHLRELLSQIMQKINRASMRDNPIKSHEVRKLLASATASIDGKEWITAQVLFESMDSLEPGNWYIYNQWGIMLRAKNDFESALGKFNQAIDFARFEDEKSLVYTEIGVLYQKNRRYNEAEDWFKKAEKADNKNKDLYLAWAEFHDELGDYFSAQTRINSILGKTKDTDSDYKELKLRHDYYNQKIEDPNYKRSFEEFKRHRRTSAVHEVRSSGARKGLRIPETQRRAPHQARAANETTIPYDITWDEFKRNYIGTSVDGTVNGVDEKYGVFVTLSRNLSGLIYWKTLEPGFEQKFSKNQPVKVKIHSATIDSDTGKKRISLHLA
jgi:Tfp pilus assembly protein PilF